MKNYFLLLLISILFFSCTENEVESQRNLPQISIEEITIAEDDFCKQVKITLDTPSDIDTEITLISEDITATNDDYQSVDEIVLIPAGETEVFIDLSINVDYFIDPDETFLLKGLVNSGNVSNVNFEGIVTIDEPSQGFPILTVGDATVEEGVDPIAIIPVAITEPIDYDLDVTLFPESITAGSDDYSAFSIQVTIPEGETIINIEIAITEDNQVEETEIFRVRAESVLNFTATVSHDCTNNQPFYDYGTITILDDD